MSHPFHIVDVFAQRKYAGNQLAVVTDAADLDGEQMQQIAAEMAYSETTFVTGAPTASGWPVRIFTPTAEIPFAGHPTLGTAAVIRDHLAGTATEEIVLDLDVGSIPVDVRPQDGHETLWMNQQEPALGTELAAADMADVLGVSSDTVANDSPVQVVSTGLPTIIVPLSDRETLEGISVDRGAYDRVTADCGADLVLAYCTEPRDADNDLAVRVFAPALGVPEDPATGSANGCLAAYLAHHEVFGSHDVDVRVEQGYELGRPSLLLLSAEREEGAIDVEVGGCVVPVAEGELL